MLVLSRKLGESLVINGEITVKVIKVSGNTVRLGIEAPKEIPVHRNEVHERTQALDGASQSAHLSQSVQIGQPVAA